MCDCHSDLITSDPLASSQVAKVIQKKVHIENPPRHSPGRPKKEYISGKKSTDDNPIKRETLYYFTKYLRNLWKSLKLSKVCFDESAIRYEK